METIVRFNMLQIGQLKGKLWPAITRGSRLVLLLRLPASARV